MFKFLFGTTDAWGPLAARLALGGVMLPHGLQKTIGLFGGHGFSGTMEFFQAQLGMPGIVAFLVIMGESVGALSLMFGFMTRFCAFSIGLIMVGAVQMAHWQHGFFMNWFGNQQGEGIEYHVLAIGLALSLMFSGAGKFSLDQKFFKA
jgi:putative oxidoreductase